MLTQAEIEAALQAAHERLRAGPLDVHPQAFIDELWERLYEPAPEALRGAVEARVLDFCARLGLLDPGHHEGPWPTPYTYPHRLT